MIDRQKLTGFWLLMRMDKPIGIYLLLWPTVWALLLAADGWPGWPMLLIFTVGVVLTRAAGCVINDYADRNFDGFVERTRQRPLVSGLVTEKEALLLFSALMLMAFLLVLLLNWQTVLLSFVALALASSYPFMKRYTYMPQVVLGAAFSWGMPMAFMAIQQQIPWWGWVLYLANLLWTVAYDTQYAMVDRDDDLKIGVKSSAIFFGQYDKLIIALLQLLTLGLLIAVAWVKALHWPYWLALLLTSGLFIYQQWLIKDRDRAKCFTAFLNNHYCGLFITLGIIGHYLIY